MSEQPKSMTDLQTDLPCPICKSDNLGHGYVQHRHSKAPVPAVLCFECNCRAPVEAWNTRALNEPQAVSVPDGYILVPRRLTAGNGGAPGNADMLELSKRIDAGLKEDDGGFFAPPLSRKQWWMIASSLDYAARFDMPAQPQGARK